LKFPQKTVPAITLAIQKNDIECLLREVHYFKSSSIQVGAVKLGEILNNLEKFGHNGNLDGIEQLHNQFLSLSEKVLLEIEDYIDCYKAA